MVANKGKGINEETKKKLKKIRNIFLLVGIPLIIAGASLLMTGFSSIFDFDTNIFTYMGSGTALLFVGLIMTFGAIYLTVVIHQREITKYFVEEGGMALGTAHEEALDGYGRVISKGSEAMAKGLKAGGGINISLDNNTKEKIMVKCRECGTLNDENAQFCDNCGKKL